MEKKYKAGMIVNTVITALALISCVVTLPKTGEYLLTQLVYIALCLFTIVYAAWGYKKPHGNLLRDLFLSYAIGLLFVLEEVATKGDVAKSVMMGVIMLGVGFVSGRLNRIDQNKFVMPLVTLLLAHEFIQILFKEPIDDVFVAFAKITPFLIWITICGAYFTRFGEHKEAGLADAPKKA